MSNIIDFPESISAYLLKISRQHLRDRLWEIAIDKVLVVSDGEALADDVIDDAITALRKLFPDKSRHDLELVLGDLRAKTIERLGIFTDGLVDARAFVGEFADELIDQTMEKSHG